MNIHIRPQHFLQKSAKCTIPQPCIQSCLSFSQYPFTLQLSRRSTLFSKIEPSAVVAILAFLTTPHATGPWASALGLRTGIRQCGPSGNPNEPWATCFLRLALGNADYDCSQINTKSCSLEGFQLAKGLNSMSTAQMRYVVRTLFCKFRIRRQQWIMNN